MTMLHLWYPLTYTDGAGRACDAIDLANPCDALAVVRIEGPERRHLCERHAAEEYPVAWALLDRFERERDEHEAQEEREREAKGGG